LPRDLIEFAGDRLGLRDALEQFCGELLFHRERSPRFGDGSK
jgi:hypothetical protein